MFRSIRRDIEMWFHRRDRKRGLKALIATEPAIYNEYNLVENLDPLTGKYLNEPWEWRKVRSIFGPRLITTRYIKQSKEHEELTKLRWARVERLIQESRYEDFASRFWTIQD